MKHLISKEHHPHLKKRAILEFAGFLLLVGLSINQRALLGDAFETIRGSDMLYLFLMCGLYWLLLPLTSISYQLLSYRKISIKTTVLAQMAGSGPGRIIPGGLGHISIGAVHLHKTGLAMRKAILITVANNLLGMITNLLIVVLAILYHPDLLNRVISGISLEDLVLIAGVTIAFSSVFLWLSHARSTRKTISKINTNWLQLYRHVAKNPHKFFTLLLIAITIIVGHASILLLAGEAISEHLSIVDALIALSAGVFIGGAVPTPGGIGAVEAGTISTLILLGYDATAAASMVVLFRIATYWQPLLPGVAAYLYLRERKLL